MAIDGQRHRGNPAPGKKPVPEPPCRPAGDDSGEHIRRQCDAGRDPPHHRRHVRAGRVGGPKNRRTAGHHQADFLRRTKPPIVPVPAIAAEQAVRRRRIGVKRHAVRKPVHRIKSKIDPDGRCLCSGPCQHMPVMRGCCCRAVKADTDRWQNDPRQLCLQRRHVACRQGKAGGTAGQRVQYLGIAHIRGDGLNNLPAFGKPGLRRGGKLPRGGRRVIDNRV